jgi:hypothetical protein
MDVPAEWGKPWESWMLIREVDAVGKRERMQTDQFQLERLDGGRWRIRHIECPGGGGPRYACVFPDEHAARVVLDDVFVQGTAVDGTWHISRFGHARPTGQTTNYGGNAPLCRFDEASRVYTVLWGSVGVAMGR